MAVKHAQSPLAPKTTPTLPRIAGVKLAAGRSGVRYKDRDDVMLAVLPAGAKIEKFNIDGSKPEPQAAKPATPATPAPAAPMPAAPPK